MEVIKINELSKSYGQIAAVNNISLSINQGEIYGLLGPNGAGKSTLINMLCGLINSDKGKISVFDKDLKKESLFIKSKLGVVPQDIAVYEELSCYDNINFFTGLYGYKGKELKEKILKALEFTGLTDAKNKIPKKLSGGMKRRLNIACSIAHDPDIIIMDEPTVGIDPQSRNHILESVKELNKKGRTIIYTTHYMEEAEGLCTRYNILLDIQQTITAEIIYA